MPAPALVRVAFGLRLSSATLKHWKVSQRRKASDESAKESRGDRTQWRTHATGAVVAAAPPATQTLCALSTIYTLSMFVMMLLAPRWKVTRKAMTSLKAFVPLALMYAYLLAMSWQPDTLRLMMPGSLQEGMKGFNPQFFPKLEGISMMFGRVATAASLWVHILTINLFFGRHTYLEGLSSGTPSFHTIMIAALLGPVALLSAAITKGVIGLWKFSNGIEDGTTVHTDNEAGKVIIDKYRTAEDL